MSGARFDRLKRHEVVLTLGGMAYAGWTDVSIETSIDSVSGGFDLTLSAREKTGVTEWPIARGMACTVTLGGETLITGWVDSVERRIAAEDYAISVRGRDKAGDLVDCSATNSPGSWRGKKLEAIAAEIAAPFGIALVIEGDTGKAFEKFALQPQETAFAAIERMARYRGLVCWSTGDGRVIIGNPGTSGAIAGRIEEGANVLSASAGDEGSERFSEYLVKGQASGSDRRNGKAAAQIRGNASDAGVTRYRPMIVIGEEQSDASSLASRAEWEARVRAGRGQKLGVTVPGWFTEGGQEAGAGTVWKAGTRATCRIPSCRIDAVLLVQRVRFSRSGDQGTVTELELVPPEAWAQLAEPEPKS